MPKASRERIAAGTELGGHPEPALLERFMLAELSASERRRIVRHLLSGCARCVAVTRHLWGLGDPRGPRRVNSDGERL